MNLTAAEFEFKHYSSAFLRKFKQFTAGRSGLLYVFDVYKRYDELLQQIIASKRGRVI